MDLTVSEFLWNYNHCAGHEGLPLGSFRTDEKGTIEVLAPLVPLYLDVEYFHNVGTGPAGVAYSANSGMKIGPEETVVAKEEWELPGITVELRVLTASGQPRPDVDVGGNWSTNTCGGGDRIARTDARGIVRLDLDATFTALGLMIGGPYSAGDREGDKNTRELTDAELHELFSKRCGAGSPDAGPSVRLLDLRSGGLRERERKVGRPGERRNLDPQPDRR
jgi:hypothetical protein